MLVIETIGSKDKQNLTNKTFDAWKGKDVSKARTILHMRYWCFLFVAGSINLENGEWNAIESALKALKTTDTIHDIAAMCRSYAVRSSPYFQVGNMNQKNVCLCFFMIHLCLMNSVIYCFG